MKTFFTLCLCLILSGELLASDYYWVGGSGNWSDFSHHWATTSGGITFHTSAPTTSDDVFFDANSFSTGSIVVVNVDAFSASLDFEGITKPLTLGLANTLTVSGSLSLSNQMTLAGYKNVVLDSPNTGLLVKTAGNTYPASLVFQGGGSWSLVDELKTNTTTAGQGISIIHGILNTNNQKLIVGRFNGNTNNGLYKEVILGNSEIHVSESFISRRIDVLSASASKIYMMGLLTTSTFTAKSGQTFGDVEFLNSSLSFTATPYNAIFNKMTAYGSVIFAGNFRTDSLILAAGKSYSLAKSVTSTVYDHFEITDNKDFPTTLKSNLAGTLATLILPEEICAENLSVQDLNLTGGSLNAAKGSVDLGNNTNVMFYPTATCEELDNPPTGTWYWVGGSGNWSDYSNHWATSSGGTVFADSVPGVNDNVVFDQNSFNDADTVVLDIEASAKNMEWVDVAHSPLFNRQSNGLTLTGSLKFSSEMSISGGGAWKFESDTISTIDFANIPVLGTFTFLGDGEWTLLSDLVTSQNIRLYRGTLNTNGFDMSMNQFDATGFQGFTSLILGSSTLTTGYQFNSYGLTVMDAGTSTIICNGSGLMRNYTYHNIELAPFGGELSGNFTANKVSISDNQYLGNSYNGGASPTIDSLIVNAGSTLHIDPVGVVTVNSFLEASGSTIKS
ncbi:MAG: hypothetical protein RIF36_01240, partial [Imperialibacter sp.]|uniref:hypothetical protein n=1 Tax=Imperialibacter sp. TaxID=2038411 RepID=UPI0032EFF7CC